MRAHVGVTDGSWYRYLADRPSISEVNFWLPGGGRTFRALERGEPFLFKLHWPENRLVGGGFFEGFVRLKVSEAWDFFGEGNGVSSAEELAERRAKYRGAEAGDEADPVIGCVLLNEVRFVASGATVEAPPNFAKSIVQGKTYGEDDPYWSSVIQPFVNVMASGLPNLEVERDEPLSVGGPVFGEARLVRPRLGQGGFAALVRDAYGKRCAITGHKIVPTLEAAHIVPVSRNGQNRLDNGLLLRSDVHTMFDRGYLGIAPDLKLHVSPRLRTEFGNGDEFYERSGQVVSVPSKRADRPRSEFLEWHMDSVFKAS